MQAVEGLACGDWLEGDHNVVRTSEHESVAAQNVLLSPVHQRANASMHSIGTTTLYSNCTIKDSAPPPSAVFRAKYSI
jgi:hypothetical protein